MAWHPGKASSAICLALTAGFLSYPKVAVAASESSPLWREFSAIRAAHLEPLKVSQAMAELYERSLSPSVRDVSNSVDGEVHELFQMLSVATFYARTSDYEHREIYLKDMGRIVDELADRHIAGDDEVKTYYESVLASRRFGEAALLKKRFDTSLAAANLPNVRLGSFDKMQPSTYRLSSEGALTLSTVELPVDAHLVIVAGCHMAEAAAEAISKNATLMAVFKTPRVIWILSDDEPLSVEGLKEWEQAFPHFPLHVAYDNAAWEGVDFSAMPTFNFFQGGKLVETLVGWDSSSSEAELATALSRIGLSKGD